MSLKYYFTLYFTFTDSQFKLQKSSQRVDTWHMASSPTQEMLYKYHGWQIPPKKQNGKFMMSFCTFHLVADNDKPRLGDRKTTTSMSKHYEKRKFAGCFSISNYSQKSEN